MIESMVYGLTIGAILYFFAIGLSITFGTMQIINFAHGAVFMLGAFTGYLLFRAGLPLIPGLAGAMIITRCCTSQVARRNVDWKVLIAIATGFIMGFLFKGKAEH